MSVMSAAEWEVMRVIWTKGETTSRFVIGVLEEKHDWSASTVKTLLRRLVGKELLEVKKEGKQFLYRAKIAEDDAILSDVKETFARFCLKKQQPILAQLLKDVPMTLADISVLEKVLQDKKVRAVPEVFCNCLKGQCRCKGGQGV